MSRVKNKKICMRGMVEDAVGMNTQKKAFEKNAAEPPLVTYLVMAAAALGNNSAQRAQVKCIDSEEEEE